MKVVSGDCFQVPRVLFGAILAALSDTMPCEDPACRCLEDKDIDRLYREGCAIISAAPGSQADTSPVDAQWVERAMELAASAGRTQAEFNKSPCGMYQDARDRARAALRTHLNTALSGDTP